MYFGCRDGVHTDQPLASSTRVCRLCRDLVATYFWSLWDMVRLENQDSCHSLLISTQTHTSCPMQITFIDERCAERQFEEHEKHIWKNSGERSMTLSEISSYLGLLHRPPKGAIFTSSHLSMAGRILRPRRHSSSYVNVVWKITRISCFPDFWEIKRMRKQCIPGTLQFSSAWVRG